MFAGGSWEGGDIPPPCLICSMVGLWVPWGGRRTVRSGYQAERRPEGRGMQCSSSAQPCPTPYVPKSEGRGVEGGNGHVPAAVRVGPAWVGGSRTPARSRGPGRVTGGTA